MSTIRLTSTTLRAKPLGAPLDDESFNYSSGAFDHPVNL
jgi:hypothetical protein